MNITAIREALADKLTQIEGVRALAYRPDQLTVTVGGTVIVDAAEEFVSYSEAMAGGQSELRFNLLVITGRASERTAQLRLDELLSAGLGETRSIYDALKPGDLPQTLGGVVHDLAVSSATGPKSLQAGEVLYLSCDVAVTVLTDRRQA